MWPLPHARRPLSLVRPCCHSPKVFGLFQHQKASLALSPQLSNIPAKISKNVACNRPVSFFSREHLLSTGFGETPHRSRPREVSPRRPREGSTRRRHENHIKVALIHEVQVALSNLGETEVIATAYSCLSTSVTVTSQWKLVANRLRCPLTLPALSLPEKR